MISSLVGEFPKSKGEKKPRDCVCECGCGWIRKHKSRRVSNSWRQKKIWDPIPREIEKEAINNCKILK